MDYETLLLERREGIGIIRMNRPRQRNALGAKLINDLIGALQEFENDPDIHAIILTSNVPGIFCAGRDLAEGSSAEAAEIIKQRGISSNPPRLFLTIRHLKKVVIAAVSGYVLAGGFGLAAWCDLIVAAEDAVFGVPEINIALFPTTAGVAIARNASSLKKCFEFFFTGERFSARQAESMGLVNRVVPPDKLEESAMELARKIASKSPATVQIGKEFFYNMLDMESTQATRYGTEIITMLGASADGREGQTAFIEKRPPRWKS